MNLPSLLTTSVFHNKYKVLNSRVKKNVQPAYLINRSSDHLKTLFVSIKGTLE